MRGHGPLGVAIGLAMLAGCQGCRHGAERGSATTSDATARPSPAPSSPDAHRSPAKLARVATIELPEGAPGIGFDDLGYSPALGKVLAPGGRSGRLDLVDPASRAVAEVPGFSRKPNYGGGHDDSVTSADAGPSVLYATDRTTQRLAVIDPSTRSIVESVKLAGHPDYVRYVAPTHEVWVTEPDADRLEVFSVDEHGAHPKHAANVAVPGGPESLVVDTDRSRLYTHLWRGATVAVDIRKRAVVARWKNGCHSSRGIALDAENGLLIAACSEGKASVLDVRDGRIVSEVKTGAGVDIIDFDPRSRHLYVPSARSGALVVASLAADGQLTRLSSIPTVRGSHCVTVDGRGNAYVCDPAHGRLLVIHDGLADH